jgi:hypothetical protein
MTNYLRDRLSLCSAIAMGLAVSTGHPLGIVAAAGMPIACLTPGTRSMALRCTLAYYATGLWPMIPAFERYAKPCAMPLAPLAIWFLAALLLSVPWTIVWTSDRHRRSLWRVPLALALTTLPPLGIIGFISPLTAAGYLFPGTAWAGLAAVALLPEVLLATRALGRRERGIVLGVALATGAGLAIGGRLLTPNDASPIPGWKAVDTHFGDVSRPFQDFVAAQSIQREADRSSEEVLIFPESVVPRWSDATKAFWHETLVRSRLRRQILAFGAGLPVNTGVAYNDGESLSDLATYDFAAAIDALKRGASQSPEVMRANASPNVTLTNNALVVVGSESGLIYQRVPVPIGMWRPFSATGVPLRIGGTGVVPIDHQRAAVLICYEQLLVFPVLASILQNPTVIVSISNTYWVADTSIPRYQSAAVLAWAKLFHLPYYLAVNS